ncbi:hypothetical protein [Rhodopirellula halodulae]|uniref:hypothetical protein n=1 Tax=Rhodopirellula halodulae TaxID=2894198 RepID=UPI001E45D274|nr:hypothetical protein [Rhodopirellula sp. JC737]
MKMRWILPLLVVVVLAVNTLPLAWSSLHWTMHPDLKRSWSWWANHANDVFYTATAILIAFTSPAKVTVLNTLSRLLVVLFVFVLLPLFAATVQGFWVVRPDSWELLRWRLNDDWQNGRALQYIVQSIYWMLATGMLWLTTGNRRLARKASPEDTLPHEAITQQSITIQRLLALTVLAAIFAAILRWLEWSPTKWEAFEMLNSVAIALAIAGTGCFAQRLHPSHRLRN